MISRRTVLSGLASAAACAAYPAAGAVAADQPPLRVAKSIAGVFAYSPIDVGLARGFYQKAGVALDVLTFNGASKMHEAMIGGALDIALGSGSTLINILKGEQTMCVAQTMGPPAELAILVPYDSPIRTPDDLKGKTIGVATTGSVTEWMAFELAKLKGWGPHGVRTVGLGGGTNSIAALRTHTVDAVIDTAADAFTLEPQKVVRSLLPCSSYVKDFVMHAIYASTDVVRTRQPALRAFLAGWFESTAYIRANKTEAVRIAAAASGMDPTAQAQEYAILAPLLSTDGRFSRPGLATIARSYVELGMLDTEPDLSKLCTEQFLPRRA